MWFLLGFIVDLRLIRVTLGGVNSIVCVYRYMMQWPGGRILQRHELDAFLAQAVSNQLYEPDQLQELKVHLVSLTVVT